MIVQGLDDRRPLARLRRRRFQHMPAQEVARDPHHEAEQERDAPAPGVERLGRHHRRKARADGGAEQDAGRGSARGESAHQAAAAGRRVLDQEHHRAGIFAADRKPLHHAQQRQRDRRRQADRRIAGQQPDQEGRDRHRRDREGQRRAPSQPVADMADERAADRSHQITDREHAERGQKLGDRILVREELAADRGREIAVDREVVPFEHVADHARGNHPICPCRSHLAARIAGNRARDCNV